VVLLDLDGRPIEGAHTLPDLGHDLWAYVLTQWLHYHTDYIGTPLTYYVHAKG
jgi:hypothetical protein